MIIIALAFLLLAPILFSTVYAEHSDDPIENWKEFQDGLDYVACPETGDCGYDYDKPYMSVIERKYFLLYDKVEYTNTKHGLAEKLPDSKIIFHLESDKERIENNYKNYCKSDTNQKYGNHFVSTYYWKDSPSWIIKLDDWYEKKWIGDYEMENALSYMFKHSSNGVWKNELRSVTWENCMGKRGATEEYYLGN